MKKIAIIFLAMLFVNLFFSCGTSENKDKNITQNAQIGLLDGHYEYLYLDDEDSSFLQIDVKGSKVTGNYTWLPKFSDGAVGKLQAEQKDNLITGSMIYEIESSTQTEVVELEMKQKDLIWKEYELKEDSQTKQLIPDKTKLVRNKLFVFKK